MAKTINDQLSLQISVSFLLKILAVTAIVVGTYYQTTSKMNEMQRTIAELHTEITVLNSKMADMEAEHLKELEHHNEELQEEIKTQRSLLQKMGLKR
tara:strand:+ start:366 stop:656 length:291 start_codon:yes stop_codon:yes gene_type:complete